MTEASSSDIDARDGQWLLALARRTLERLAPDGGSQTPDEARVIPDDEIPPNVRPKRGVFVTLRKHGALRGCIGYIVSPVPLYRAVIENAVSAARRDPRFPPVSSSEVPDLHIEISVLTVPRKIQTLDEIVVGRHGLIATQGHMRGLLLPQVPGEYGWDRDTFLDHTCMKAGLARDAWRSGKVQFEVFSATIFAEAERGGARDRLV
ncbi:AmmeMemoRadiSam system protein A [Candidatus Sumerlaeota bacterium]|nr:AmmeMemoRadiSam system protein A [Candidatus Sumerlaeota bacterium]